MAKAKFKVGDRVRAIGADALVGKVTAVHEQDGLRPGWLYEVLLDSGSKIPAIEMDLEKVRVRKGAKSLGLRAKYKAARKPKPLTFADLSIGERFSGSSFPQGRLYQKITDRFAIDLSEGVDRDGFFIKDRFVGTYPVRRRTEPQVSFDPAKLIQVN